MEIVDYLSGFLSWEIGGQEVRPLMYAKQTKSSVLRLSRQFHSHPFVFLAGDSSFEDNNVKSDLLYADNNSNWQWFWGVLTMAGNRCDVKLALQALH